MNVKVLLLPDGKDPDEFARNHSAEDFRKYIEDNQTDFIVFKINILLNGVTDPVKRSEAVGSIVQSISVIKDPILRDTYIRECANRTGVSERTLMEQMNRNIYSNREQQTREQQQQRDAVIRQQQVEEQATVPVRQVSKVEQMLVQAVVKDGEKVIFRDVKDEDSGQVYSLTVAQYIAYDLGSDNLGFSNELYTRILQEAVDHCGEEGFKAEEYFTQHADIHIASVAVRLSVDRFQLAESLQVKETEQTLRDRVLHLVADFRLDYVSSHLKELMEKMRQTQDSEEMMKIMEEIKKLQLLRNELAKKLGSEILI
jgi:DNA primase